MDSSQRRRWTVLLATLLLTLAAAFLGPAPAEVPELNTERVPARSGIPAPQHAATEIAPVFAEEGAADPFEKRGWAEPLAPAPLVAPAPVERIVAPVIAEPAGPPSLPYRYVGKLSDESGSVIYLARGEVAFVARVGETLEGAYKVAALQARSVEFEYVPTGAKQSLPIPDAE
ncbi:hypothetical protein [Duganella sp. Root1480D1]|uniref:hypothetical protein n=1 Tax=Duganella sp. Root1480D1 TaxID=1736471 RepID=UPI0007162423|nr:hypothetical protein [Duganella sp. Root1480D1]KQZ32564.1 hypothetical protein ASD58_08020 [Duganella sp. Root1480D1]